MAIEVVTTYTCDGGCAKSSTTPMKVMQVDGQRFDWCGDIACINTISTTLKTIHKSK